MSMPEIKQKWKCKECGVICNDPLSAENPFCADRGSITGCPSCFAVESFEEICQFYECDKPVAGGYPGGYGFRYFSACSGHTPPCKRRSVIVGRGVA